MTSLPVTAIVVDDDPDTIELFAEYLELKGITVLGKGYDGRQAIELFQQLRPQIIFLDIMMPYYDGFYALEEIRRTDPNAKIIMVTADLTKETARKLDELNVFVVYKPYEFDDIMTIVKRITHSSLDQNVVT